MSDLDDSLCHVIPLDQPPTCFECGEPGSVMYVEPHHHKVMCPYHATVYLTAEELEMLKALEGVRGRRQ